MAYKTIVTFVTDLETDRHATEAAVALAGRLDAHLDIVCLGLDRTEPGLYYAGASAIVLQDNHAQAEADAKTLETGMTRRMKPEPLSYTIRRAALQVAALPPLVTHRARLADLAVLPKPYGEARGREAESILEAALFNAGVPVLMIPDGADLPVPGAPLVVAWNESREALAAIRAALPFLQESGNVSLTIVDPPSHGPDRSDPGGELSEVLSRHGVRTEVSVLARTMPRISDILARHARDTGAALLVMGAYGHSRFREAILGGATRNMLEMAEIPVLMAR